MTVNSLIGGTVVVTVVSTFAIGLFLGIPIRKWMRENIF